MFIDIIDTFYRKKAVWRHCEKALAALLAAGKCMRRAGNRTRPNQRGSSVLTRATLM